MDGPGIAVRPSQVKLALGHILSFLFGGGTMFLVARAAWLEGPSLWWIVYVGVFAFGSVFLWAAFRRWPTQTITLAGRLLVVEGQDGADGTYDVGRVTEVLTHMRRRRAGGNRRPASISFYYVGVRLDDGQEVWFQEMQSATKAGRLLDKVRAQISDVSGVEVAVADWGPWSI